MKSTFTDKEGSHDKNELEQIKEINPRETMEFNKEKTIEKYIRLREEVVDPYQPDFDTANDTIGYVKFNDAWTGTNPYNRLMLPRLTNKKNTFPKAPRQKIPKNANPDNYVKVSFDSEGKVRTASLGKYQGRELIIVYVSDQLNISYMAEEPVDGKRAYSLSEFQWCEFDDRGRLVSTEEYQCAGVPTDDFKMSGEYYEYEGDVLSRAWYFRDFNKYPMEMSTILVLNMIPDRIYNPDQFEYIFTRTADGMDVTIKQYYRTSQTLTYEEHVSQETLSHLAENGFRFA